MSIRKLADKPRTLPWRARVHGGKVRMFASKDEAQRWVTEFHRTLRLTGLPPTMDDLQKHTVGELVERYLKEKTPHKGSAVSERSQLGRFLKRPICQLSLAAIKRSDVYKYRDERLRDTWYNKPITPRTVRREFNTIRHIFAVAKEEWGFENLENPFRIKIERSHFKRKRRLDEGELEKLELACNVCKGLNKSYVLLAIYLAIETGMRLQEIFNLTWKDTNFVKRRIEIRKSKTDRVSEYEGRTIVMTGLVRGLFGAIKLSLLGNFQYTPESRIFPMTHVAFKQSWQRVVKRAGIRDLHFHDLRREAGSRFDEAGLTRGEHDLMMGHANKDIAGLYIHANMKSIQDKLDRYRFDGKTWDEASAELKTKPEQRQLDRLLARGQEIWVEQLKAGKPITLSVAMSRSKEEMTSKH